MNKYINKQEFYKTYGKEAGLTFEYDGCEYIKFGETYNSLVIIHKANCKFCIERLEEANDQNIHREEGPL